MLILENARLLDLQSGEANLYFEGEGGGGLVPWALFVIFGSGARIRFPRPALLRELIAKRIGFETMDTPAACRTYNVLLAEGRSVVAALLFEPAPG